LVSYPRLEECPSHDAMEQVDELSWGVGDVTAGDFLERVRSVLGREAVVETNHDLLSSLTCTICDHTFPRFASLGKVTVAQGLCPQCTAPCTPNMYHTLDEHAPLDKTLHELGVPLWDVLTGRNGVEQRHYEFSGDRQRVLGPLADCKETP
jgi:hypothetical protein